MIKKLQTVFNKKLQLFTLTILLLILCLFVFSNLGYENINVDQFLWYERSEKFFSAIKEGRYLDTYQQYHPGVTLMYLIGLGQSSYKYFTGDLSDFSAISYGNFGIYNFHTKLYVVVFCLGLLIYSAHLIHKIYGKVIISLSFLTIILFESFYIGVLRNLHLDGILSALIFSSILSFYYACTKKSLKSFIISGILTGLGYLTKSVSIFIPIFCFIIFLYFLILNKTNRKNIVRGSIVWLLISIALFFALFPAMWVEPINIITTIVREGVIDTGVDGSFYHYLNNTVTQDPGITFYLKVLGYRVTPFLQFLLIYYLFYLVNILKNHKLKDENILNLLSIIFVMLFFIIFVFLDKKTDRYLAPLFPFLCLLGSYSFYILVSRTIFLKTKIMYKLPTLVLFVILVTYNFWNVLSIRPYYFAYYNHFFGGINTAKKEMYINQGGIGVFEIAEYLEKINLPQNARISATNERELQKVSRYKIEPPYPHLKKEYDLVITPLQRDAYFKWKKKIIKTFKIQGQDYWYVFSDLDTE